MFFISSDAAAGERTITPADHHFARFHIAHEFRTDQIERATLRSQNIIVIELTQNQWTNTDRIAQTNQRIAGQHHKGIRAFHQARRIDHLVAHRQAAREGGELHENL